MSGNNAGAGTAVEGERFFNAWSGTVLSFDLHQQIKDLPVGTYTLSAFIRNTDTEEMISNQRIYANSQGAEYRSDIMTRAGIGSTAADWEELYLKFYILNEGDSVRIGMRSTGSSDTGSAGWFQADNFTLVYDGEVEEEGLVIQLGQTLDDLIDQTNDYQGFLVFNGLYGLADELNEPLDDAYIAERESREEILLATENLKNALKNAQAGMVAMERLKDELLYCEDILNNCDGYPGYDTFNEVYTEVSGLYDEPYYATSVDILANFDRLIDGKVAYFYSQNFSAEQPANYTFLIQYPSFRTQFSDQGAENTATSEGWVNRTTVLPSSGWDI